MKKEDIYVGTLMRSITHDDYLNGLSGSDKAYIPEFEELSTKTCGYIYKIIRVKENAIFIKKGDQYVCLDLLNNGIKTFLVNIGFAIKPISTDYRDGGYYILNGSLEPYYTQNLEENIYVKKLKRQVLLERKTMDSIEQ